MLKNVIISSESHNLYTTERFLSESKSLGLKTTYFNPYQSDLLIKLNNKTSKQKLNETSTLFIHRTTGIRFDEFDILVASDYEQRGAKIVNPLKNISVFRSKDFQQLFFRRHQIPFIPTFTFRGEIKGQYHNQLQKMSKNEEYILKTIRGNGGIGVQILRGLDSILSVLETQKAMNDQRYIIQPYYKHESELRVFLTKNKILAVIEKKIIDSDFRGNSKRSKGRSLKKIDQNLIDLCQNIMVSSGLEYAGIDLFLKDNQYFVLEVNAIPGFKQVEELSKINIAKELLIEFIN
jgi:glutathione synthase/RimK-type ligase-like ATP-grasp enzyme